MQIVACYAVWNEAAQIADSLRSVKAYVDRFVVVDAAYEDNPAEATHSTDGTRELCEAICDPVPLTYLESDRKVPQNTARNRYLEALVDGDWALVIDGDEVLYGAYDHVRRLVAQVRDGAFDVPVPVGYQRSAVGLMVHTQALLASGPLDQVTAQQYATAPIVGSAGWMARLFRVDGGLRYPPGRSNQGLFRDGRWVGRPVARDEHVLIVNHRLRQTLGAYLLDHAWLAKVRGGPSAAEALTA